MENHKGTKAYELFESYLSQYEVHSVGLILPNPPSANAYWRAFRNRIIVSTDAKKYKESIVRDLPIYITDIIFLKGKDKPFRYGKVSMSNLEPDKMHEDLQELIKSKFPLFPKKVPLLVTGEHYRAMTSRDVTNTGKVLFDSLQKQLYADDNQIVDYSMKANDNSKGNPRVILRIERIDRQ